MFRTSSVHHQEHFLRAVFADLVCVNMRATRHIQPLQSCSYNFVMAGLHIYYKMIHSPYNIKLMRRKFNNFIIILVHAATEETDEPVKDSIFDKLNQLYQRIPARDTKIIMGEFNAKIEREVFKPVIGIWSLCETSNENLDQSSSF